MSNIDMGRKIQAIRIKHGIAQSHIEAMLNKPKGWLSRRECGNAIITARDLFIIFKALNEPVDIILQ